MTAAEQALDPAAPSAEAPVDVVYVAGAGRSGTTLLARLLGQVEGWVSLGEVRYVWERGLVEDRLCECGAPFRTCPFWDAVMTEAFGDAGRVPAADLTAAEGPLLRTRHALAAYRAARDPRAWAAQQPQYLEHLGRLYPALRRVSGCDVVVDSSKLPAYAQVLRATGRVRLHVVHLVRDPRATAHSWRRKKASRELRGPAHMPRHGLLHTSAVWTSSNLLAEQLLAEHSEGYVRLRYEELVADPDAVVRDVVARLGLPGTAPDLTGEDVELRSSHAAAGNPDLHVRGPVRVALDDAWRTEMPPRDARLVSALTLPLRKRYGIA